MDEQTLLRMLAGGQGTTSLADVAAAQERRKRLEDMMRGIMLGGGPAGPPGINGNPMAPMPQMGRGTGVPTVGGVTGVGLPAGGMMRPAPQEMGMGSQPRYMQDAERALAVLRNAVEAQGPAPDPVAQRADMERNSMFQTDAARQAARQGLFDRNLKSLDRLTGATPELTGQDAERVAAAMGTPYRRESITASGPGWSVARGVGSDWKQQADEAARLRDIEGSKAAVEMLRQAARAKLGSVKPATADLMENGPKGQVDQAFRSQLAANRRADIAARQARGQAALQQRFDNSPMGRLMSATQGGGTNPLALMALGMPAEQAVTLSESQAKQRMQQAVIDDARTGRQEDAALKRELAAGEQAAADRRLELQLAAAAKQAEDQLGIDREKLGIERTRAGDEAINNELMNKIRLLEAEMSRGRMANDQQESAMKQDALQTAARSSRAAEVRQQGDAGSAALADAILSGKVPLSMTETPDQILGMNTQAATTPDLLRALMNAESISPEQEQVLRSYARSMSGKLPSYWLGDNRRYADELLKFANGGQPALKEYAGQQWLPFEVQSNYLNPANYLSPLWRR